MSVFRAVSLNGLVSTLTALVRESAGLYWHLLIAMVPVMVLVRLGADYGLIDWVAQAFQPLMEVVGLPAATGLVWAATVLINIYTGAAVLVAVFGQLDLTVAQLTVLLSMMLMAHALPVEQSISRRAGVGIVYSTALRLGGALAYGWVLGAIYGAGGWLQDPAAIGLMDGLSADLTAPWGEWAVSNLVSLFWLYWLILVLVTGLRILDAIKITAFLTRMLTPFLRLMGISDKAASLTMVGGLLGLAFGGGLIIKEARAGHLAPRDVVLSLSFMGLCHSLIEDTLICVALGGDVVGLLVGRFVFAVVVTVVLARLIHALSDQQLNRYVFSGRSA